MSLKIHAEEETISLKAEPKTIRFTDHLVMMSTYLTLETAQTC